MLDSTCKQFDTSTPMFVSAESAVHHVFNGSRLVKQEVQCIQLQAKSTPENETWPPNKSKGTLFVQPQTYFGPSRPIWCMGQRSRLVETRVPKGTLQGPSEETWRSGLSEQSEMIQAPTGPSYLRPCFSKLICFRVYTKRLHAHA